MVADAMHRLDACQDTGSMPAGRYPGATLTMDCCSKYSAYGKYIRFGYELFLKQLHVAQGGVNVSGKMHRIELVLADDVSDRCESVAKLVLSWPARVGPT